MAVFRAELQPGDAPPDDPLFPFSGPGASLVGRPTLPAHQQLGQGVFSGVFILISCGARLAPFDIREVRELMETDEMELDTLGDRKTALFLICEYKKEPSCFFDK